MTFRPTNEEMKAWVKTQDAHKHKDWDKLLLSQRERLIEQYMTEQAKLEHFKAQPMKVIKD